MDGTNVHIFDYGRIMRERSYPAIEINPAYHRLYHVYGGYASVEGFGEPMVLSKNCLYIFPTNCSYNINYDPKYPLNHMWFHFSCIPPVMIKQPFIIKENESPLAFYMLQTLRTYIDPDGNGLQINLKDDSFTGLILLRNLLADFISILIKEYKLPCMTDMRIIKVINLIHNNFEEDLSNEILAKSLNLNHRYFIKIFKEIMGITPQRYLLNYRLNIADILLHEGVSITEVAKRIGYDDYKVFSQTYFNNRGVRPKKYANTPSEKINRYWWKPGMKYYNKVL